MSEDAQSSFKSDSNTSANGEPSSFSSVSQSYESSQESNIASSTSIRVQGLNPGCNDRAVKQKPGELGILAANKISAIERTDTRENRVESPVTMAENKSMSQSGGILSDCSEEIGSTSVTKPVDHIVELLCKDEANVTHPTPSGLRLSLSLDGKAKVINGEEASPPRGISSQSGQDTKRTLQRSKSASSILSKASPTIGRGGVGRSWDSRTWEFFCEKNKVDRLDAMATLERSGSAAAAISLIRSRSNQSLNPNFHNGNGQYLRVGPKRVRADGHQGKKPKLARTTSSLSRLESNVGANPKTFGKTKPRLEAEKDDSNKENWLPGTQLAPVNQRRTFNNQAAHLLQENHTAKAYGSESRSKDSTPKLRKRNKPEIIMIYEDEDPGAKGLATQQNPELPSNTRLEDIDCVQNLLSLSQGNWR
jgi:hypothetical protein